MQYLKQVNHNGGYGDTVGNSWASICHRRETLRSQLM